MTSGLTDNDLRQVAEVLQRHTEVQEAILFGSRALGNFKAGSDVDIALKGDGPVTSITSIRVALNEELPLPYMFDIIDYDTISSKQLREHIDHCGQPMYRRAG